MLDEAVSVGEDQYPLRIGREEATNTLQDGRSSRAALAVHRGHDF